MRGSRALSPLLLASTLSGSGLLVSYGPVQAQPLPLASETFTKVSGVSGEGNLVSFDSLDNGIVGTGVDALTTHVGQQASTGQVPAPAPQAPQPLKPIVPPADPNAPIISEIIVTGNRTLNKAYIISASGHNVGEPCTPEVLSDMRTKLFATGYFGATSRTAHEEDAVRVTSLEKEKGKCQVTIELDENTTIMGVQINGTGPIKPDEVLQKLHLKPGTAFNYNQFVLDMLDVNYLYQKKGYYAQGGPGADIDSKGILNISMIVTRVAEIKIVGNHKTRRNVILRAMSTKQGDYLNANTLEQDRKNLINMDLFEPGGVTYSDYDLGLGRIGVTINLVEKRSGTVTAGFGYSNRAQLIGFVEVSESNFQGRAESVNVRGELGGVAGRAGIEMGFTEPYLDRRRTALNVQLYDKTVYRFSDSFANSVATQSTSGTSRYNEQRLGGTLTVSRPFQRTYRGAISFRGEQVMTDPLDLSVNNAQIIQDGPIFVLGGQLIHNTRDLDIDPVMGGFQTLNLQTGYADLHSPKTFTGITIPGITGSVNFSKVFLDARQYFSLNGPRRRDKPDQEKTTLATRVQLGSSVGTLPFFEQFFVGGGESLRGYKDDRFWGSNLFLASAELRQPLARQLRGVLFADLGSAWGGDYNNVNISGFAQDGFHPHLGVGLGMRVNTPIGPLRLDYGFGDEGGRFHFSIGPTF